MIKKYFHNNHVFCYELKKSKRAKNARISIHRDQSIVVTLPNYLSVSYAENLLAQKINWVIWQINKIRQKPNYNLLLYKKSKKDYQKNKKQALRFVREKIQKINTIYNFEFNNISIRNQKTRWGSCSSSKNLCFNYKLIYLPEKLAEYIVAHELCHLSYLNHSKQFWKLVSKSMPEYKKIVSELRNI